MPGRCQAVFDTHGGADFIEGMLATGLPVFCCGAVGELRTLSVSNLMSLIGEASMSRCRNALKLK